MKKNLLTTYIRLFQMPLFILVSGYFAKPALCLKDLLERAKKALVRIGLPYMCWTVLSYGIELLQEKISGGGQPVSIIGLIKQASFLWFLGCLLICQLCYLALSFIRQKNQLVGNILFALSFLCTFFIPMGYLNIFKFPFLWIFYLAGAMLRKTDIKEVIAKKETKIIVGFASLLVLIFEYAFQTKWTFYNVTNYIGDGGAVKLIALVLRYLLYFGATGSFLVICFLCYGKASKMQVAEVVVGIGKRTLFLYVAHVTLLFYTLRPAVYELTDGKGLLPDLPFIRYYIIATLIAALTVLVLNCLYRLFDRNKITRVLLLGK